MLPTYQITLQHSVFFFFFFFHLHQSYGKLLLISVTCKYVFIYQANLHAKSVIIHHQQL